MKLSNTAEKKSVFIPDLMVNLLNSHSKGDVQQQIEHKPPYALHLLEMTNIRQELPAK